MAPDPITPIDSSQTDRDADTATDTDTDASADSDGDEAKFEPLTVSPRRAGESVTVVSRDAAAIAVSEFPAYVAEDGRVKHRDIDTGFNAIQYQVRD